MTQRRRDQRSELSGGPGMRPVSEWDQYRQDRREQWRDDKFAATATRR